MSTITNAAIEAWLDLDEKEQLHAMAVLACDAPDLLLRAAELARRRSTAQDTVTH